MINAAKLPLLFAVFAALSLLPRAGAQELGRPTATIRQPIDESRLVTLHNNTRPEANAQNDRGPVSDDFALDHLLLQLKRSPASETALQQYIAQLHDRNSPNYHKWLTPDQFAESFGVAKSDVIAVSQWLESHGFKVNGVQSSGLVIDFSGNARQVREAYHTDIHHLMVDGRPHFANMSDPQIPAALAPSVEGIISLNNFHPKAMHHPRGNYTYTTSNGTFHALAAGDIATIYNLSPLFTAGISGKGQSIMVVEDTYLYSTTDWTVFRKTFGLARPYPYGTLSQVSPTGAITCTNPGFQGAPADPGYGDDGEAIIDVEWSSAAAPNAAIILAACTDTTAFGGLIALENTLNGPAASLPSVVSISYGEAEAVNGAASNAAYNSAYQQAVAEGVSIFVSSGDENAASADNGNDSVHGIGVSGFTSTPYDVSVGGTDFGYTADNVDPSVYWSATNSSTYSSALSYIQEIPWNDSCASSLLAAFLAPLIGTSPDPQTFCNSSLANSDGLRNAIGGSGGPSGCATGAPASGTTNRGVVSGTCAGYAKPSWQSGLFGNPSDGVRDIPDVSLFASNGFWDAYYVVCWSNPDTNIGAGFTCTGPPSTWAGFGGTSVSSPIMAAIQALVNQKTGSRWGNPNTVYYSLANTEFGTDGSGATSCNSTTVNKFSNNCIFYDVTEGDNDSACTTRATTGNTLHDCYRPTGTIGILSTSNDASQPAYVTNSGWDFPTGIGSVNAYNLVMNWP
ncbi:MAG: protease pro-enzyme activation domain-containing protein [Candidatus Acidiferrales bacterium]